MSAKHKVLALDSFNNMNLFGDEECCRIRSGLDCPYSGVTAVVDFTAHNHIDKNNTVGGTTAIISVSKPEVRGENEESSEQAAPRHSFIHSLYF